MSRVFNSDINSNLHPDFFEFKNVPPVDNRTLQTVERGDLTFSDTNKKYDDVLMFSDKTSRKNYASKVLAGIQEVTPFSLLYFSKENIDELQRLIRYKVYISTNKQFIIDNQNETELVIVMRAMFLQYSKLPDDYSKYKQEINRINSLVINKTLPDIISGVKQYVGYIKDSTQNYIPISRGTNQSIAGEKTLRSVSDVLVGDDNFFNMNH